MRLLSLTFSLLLSINIFAASTLKMNCKSSQTKFVHNQLLLNLKSPQQPQIYVLENISKQSLLLNHEKNPPGASAGWASILDASRASAILLTPQQQKFAMTCSLVNTPQALDCAKLLKVCQVSNFTLQNNSRGNFWLIENISAEEILATIEAKLQRLT